MPDFCFDYSRTKKLKINTTQKFATMLVFSDHYSNNRIRFGLIIRYTRIITFRLDQRTNKKIAVFAAFMHSIRRYVCNENYMTLVCITGAGLLKRYTSHVVDNFADKIEYILNQIPR